MSAPLPPRVFDSPALLGAELAREIADGIAEAAGAGWRYVLGCPGGRSPKPVYEALAELTAERRLDLRHVVIAMMDEYVLPDPDAPGGFHDVDHGAHNSCHRFAAEEIVAPLDAAAGPGRGIPADAVWFPDPPTRRPTSGASSTAAASTCSSWPAAPPTGTSPSTRPAPTATAPAGSSNSRTPPASTTWAPSPASPPSTRCPGTASPSVWRPSWPTPGAR